MPNYGKRFSEDKYLSKEQVKQELNMYSIDPIWAEILSYRKNMGESLELPSIDRTKFSLTYTKYLTSKLFILERKLVSLALKLSKYDRNELDYIKDNLKVNVLLSVLNAQGVEQTRSFVLSLVQEELSSIPNDSIVIDNYNRALNYMVENDFDKVDDSLFLDVYSLLCYGEKEDIAYREVTFLAQKYFPNNFVYDEAPLDRIKPMMQSLGEFIKDDSLLMSVRGIATLFYLDYLKPFNDFREEFACLGLKLCLSLSDLKGIAPYLNFEQVYLEKDPVRKEKVVLAQKTYDLTYYFIYMTDKLIEVCDKTEEDIDSLEASFVPSNSYDEKASAISNLTISSFPQSNKTDNIISLGVKEAEDMMKSDSSIQPVQIYTDADVALPVLKAGLSVKDIERITNDLIETYPVLKYSQAHFYAGHCTIGHTYTIQQFKKEEQTSYETARTSMDFLAKLGFYQKSQLKNKFVYRPIPRRKKNHE
ncbi:MAG: hypothetical protein IAC78_02675 [Firmicutes bacterium]|uniref:Uncharacterized protein n=1 Tax=Candidatus Scatoplasma merdavium TaxID=2840932 RepID=A0A9D9D726_9BACL|nr:hypothetical protein [Candidatus Scatoplasma merdavium]